MPNPDNAIPPSPLPQTHPIGSLNQMSQSVLYPAASLIPIRLFHKTSRKANSRWNDPSPNHLRVSYQPSNQSAITSSAATALIGTSSCILALPYIRRANASGGAFRHCTRSHQGYFPCIVLSVYSLTTTGVRPTAEGSCQDERSPAKGRDDNYQFVYGGYVDFVNEPCYGGPVILDCNIASAAGAEEWGRWGTHEETICKIAPPSSITAANAAPLGVTFLKTGA